MVSLSVTTIQLLTCYNHANHSHMFLIQIFTNYFLVYFGKTGGTVSGLVFGGYVPMARLFTQNRRDAETAATYWVTCLTGIVTFRTVVAVISHGTFCKYVQYVYLR